MTAYVFIFTPIYIERRNGTATDVAVSCPEDVQNKQGSVDVNASPFWTWFIDNPRPSSSTYE